MFKDLFGKAMLDFATNNNPENIVTETNISEADEMDVSYLFRSFKEMPKLEQKALKLAKEAGVDIFAFNCKVYKDEIELKDKVEIII